MKYLILAFCLFSAQLGNAQLTPQQREENRIQDAIQDAEIAAEEAEEAARNRAPDADEKRQEGEHKLEDILKALEKHKQKRCPEKICG